MLVKSLLHEPFLQVVGLYIGSELLLLVTQSIVSTIAANKLELKRLFGRKLLKQAIQLKIFCLWVKYSRFNSCNK